MPDEVKRTRGAQREDCHTRSVHGAVLMGGHADAWSVLIHDDVIWRRVLWKDASGHERVEQALCPIGAATRLVSKCQQ